MGLLYRVAKNLAFRTPKGVQTALKHMLHAHRIRRGTFDAGEPEWHNLEAWIRPGGTVIDVGANIGCYALRMSDLVGPEGRVIAFEPIAETFCQLARNVLLARYPNITLFNTAVSDRTALVKMSIPDLAGGSENFYMAHIDHDTAGGLAVLSVAVDGLGLAGPVQLIKLDVEGHELQALRGMRGLLARDKPALIVEGRNDAVGSMLSGLGYRAHSFPGSPNTVFTTH